MKPIQNIPEIIQRIEEIESILIPEDHIDFSGYKITTDKQKILLLIANRQICCEGWGYFLSEDEVEYFTGAELLDITLTDTQLRTYEAFRDSNREDLMVLFVNLKTSRGVLQFVAYNIHNGCYGHKATVISNQLIHEEVL